MDYLKNPKMIMVIAGCLALHVILAVGFAMQKSGAYAKNQRAIENLTQQWINEDEARKAEQEGQLLDKYGTTKPDRIAFDPRLDIGQGFDRLLLEVLPSTYERKISTDRFADFKIVLHTENLPERTVLAGWLREVFSRIDPVFVYRFIVTDNERATIITRGQLRCVTDWKYADNVEIIRCCGLE
jgi:hypothetical protein